MDGHIFWHPLNINPVRHLPIGITNICLLREREKKIKGKSTRCAIKCDKLPVSGTTPREVHIKFVSLLPAFNNLERRHDLISIVGDSRVESGRFILSLKINGPPCCTQILIT